MSDTYYARYRGHTTEVEAENHTDARSQAAAELPAARKRYIHIEQLDDDETRVFYEGVTVTVDADAEWTCTVRITDDDEVLAEYELVDEFGLHGVVVDVQHGTMEVEGVSVSVHGFTHDGRDAACVYVRQSTSDFN